MSHIENLIAELCPDGVDFKVLGEVASLRRGQVITQKNAVAGSIPVIAGGRSAAYFHNESNRDEVSIVIAGSGAYAGYVSYWEQPIWVSDAFTVEPDKELILERFLYYVLTNRQAEIHHLKSGSGVPHVYPKQVARLRIPVPPVEVQREIVRILDRFTQLEAELEAELEARRRQYAYYRDQLLTFDEAGGVRWIPMCEVGKFVRGRRFTKRDMVRFGVQCIHYGEIYTHYGVSANQTISYIRPDFAGQLQYAQRGDVVIAGMGETVSDVAKAVAWLGDVPVAIHDDSFYFRSEQNPVYISYAMQTAYFQAQKERHVSRAKVKRIGSKGLGQIRVPIPPLEEQQRIVEILDRFDALVNDISTGLPAEIAARRKQYEYYRDKLLTFKEKQ